MKDRLIQIRKHLQLTQAEFAEQMEVSKAFISDIESGKCKPVCEKILYRIHEKFNVSLNWLLSGAGEMFVR